MRFLLEAEGDPFEAARAARDAGLDGVLFSAWPAPLVVAAAVAPVVDGILIAAEVALGDRHPIEVAEEAAVVDLLAAGRLIVIAKPAGDAFGEALDLLRTAWAARPFAFAGPTWRVPARLPQNEHNLEDRVRVTPAPLQPRLELWTAGEWPDDARALGHLAAAPGDGTAAPAPNAPPSGEGTATPAALSAAHPAAALAAAWARAERALGPALIGAPRARRHDFSPRLVDELRAGREAFGQDWAVVRGTAADAARIGADVRPLVQLDRLPAGIEAHWALRYDQPIGSF